MAAEMLTPRTRRPPDEWGRKNREYPPSSGHPGPRDPSLTPYWIPLARAVHEGRYSRYVGVSQAQSGKTETVLDIIGERLDDAPVPLLYVGPSKEFLTDQFEPRLMSLLDEAPSLRDKVVRGRRAKKTLKRINGVRLRLAHAGSSTALKSDPAGFALVDEYDEMLANIKGQGDPLGLVEARGDTYADFQTVVISTPSVGLVETATDERSGLEFWAPADPKRLESGIWKLWQEGTRHHWTWCCPHCRDWWFVPRLRLLQWPGRGTEEECTAEEALHNAWIECRSCGCEIRDEDKAWMNAHGLSVAPGQWIENGVVLGEPVETRTWSIWTSGLASPFKSFGQRAHRYLEAKATLQTDKVQTAVNAAFGECYSDATEGDALEWREVLARKGVHILRQAPPEVLRVVGAVDVQKRGLYWVIVGFGGEGRAWLLDYGMAQGPTDTSVPWSAVWGIMTAPVDGLFVERVFVDSGFRPDKASPGSVHVVYDECKAHSWIAFPTKGTDTLGAVPYRASQIEVTSSGARKRYALDLVHLNTDFFKSWVHDGFRRPVGAPRTITVAADTRPDFALQIASEVRSIVNLKPKWVQLSADNHYLDCLAMACAAAYSLNVLSLPAGIVRLTSCPLNDPPPPPAPPASKAPASVEVQGTVPPVPVVAQTAAAPDLRRRFGALAGRFSQR